MTPSRASATTSASSARVPQFEKITEVSRGTPPKRIGKVPPASPSSETWPPGGHGAGGQRERVVAADAVDDQRGAAAAGGAPQLADGQTRRRSATSAPRARPARAPRRDGPRRRRVRG